MPAAMANVDIVTRLRDPARGWHPDQVEAADEIERLRDLVSGYESMQDQHREHVRRLDVALNGGGAAKQASLVDLVSQFERR